MQIANNFKNTFSRKYFSINDSVFLNFSTFTFQKFGLAKPDKLFLVVIRHTVVRFIYSKLHQYKTENSTPQPRILEDN